MRLYDVSQRPELKASSITSAEGSLADEQYLGLGGKLADLAGRFNSIQPGESEARPSRIKSGCSWAFWTASNPSDTSQMTCSCDPSPIIEQTYRRKN